MNLKVFQVSGTIEGIQTNDVQVFLVHVLSVFIYLKMLALNSHLHII